MLAAANAYLRSYTGLSDDEIDGHAEFVIAVYVLVQDMYDNRVMNVDKNNVNRTVETILNMHRVNYV
jgi:hypothetical protein